MAAPVLNDLKWFHCEERSALSTNGGRLSTTEIVSGVINNLWPNVLRQQRVDGDNLLRKMALKVHQDGNGTLPTTEFVLDGPTLGDDRIFMFGGTATDTQADITGSERRYCAGGLVSPVSAGATSLTFAVKHADDTAGVQIGDDIRVSNKLSPSASTGTVEYVTVTDKSVSGLQVTLTFTPALGNAYAAYNAGAGGKVGVIYKAGVTAAGHGTIVKTSSAGLFDATGDNAIQWNNQGADEHTLTLTLSSATAFAASSNRFGALAAGSTTADYSPLHPFWSKPLLTIPAAAWGGTFAGGDTVVIPLHACAAYVWEKRIVPQGCAPLSANRVYLVNRSEGL